MEFIKLEVEVLNVLNNLEAEDFFVSDASIKLITATLDLETKNVNELRATRNSIVKELNNTTYDDMTRKSMITAVIDRTIFLQGDAV